MMLKFKEMWAQRDALILLCILLYLTGIPALVLYVGVSKPVVGDHVYV